MSGVLPSLAEHSDALTYAVIGTIGICISLIAWYAGRQIGRIDRMEAQRIIDAAKIEKDRLEDREERRKEADRIAEKHEAEAKAFTKVADTLDQVNGTQNGMLSRLETLTQNHIKLQSDIEIFRVQTLATIGQISQNQVGVMNELKELHLAHVGLAKEHQIFKDQCERVKYGRRKGDDKIAIDSIEKSGGFSEKR